MVAPKAGVRGGWWIPSLLLLLDLVDRNFQVATDARLFSPESVRALNEPQQDRAPCTVVDASNGSLLPPKLTPALFNEDLAQRLDASPQFPPYLAKSPNTSQQPSPQIDIISIGSLGRPQLQDAQEKTFAKHPSVRNFFRINELNDTEATCHSHLTFEEVRQVSNFCRNFRKGTILWRFTRGYAGGDFLYSRSNPAGWLCAQKRPIDGLVQVLQTYQTHSLPDYLVLIDDDSWLHVPRLIEQLPVAHPATQPHAVAGCIMRTRPRMLNFTFAFGGFGQVFTRTTLERWRQPVYCGPHSRGGGGKAIWFQRHVCRRLRYNSLGEAKVFRPGMSVADIMYYYTHDHSYRNVSNWDPHGPGFCMHSDWMTSYFVNFYQLAKPTGRLDHAHDRLQSWGNRSTYWTNVPKGECLFNKDRKCQPFQSTFCHYITPPRMLALHHEVVEEAQVNATLAQQ